MRKIYGPSNLQKLQGIMRETGKDQVANWSETDVKCKKPFFPVFAVTPNDRLYVIFVNIGIILTDRVNVFGSQKRRNDLTATNKRNLRVRDNGGWQ